MPKAAEILPGPGSGQLDDSHITTDCPECGLVLTLGEAVVSDVDPLETTYLCGRCGGTVLIVSTIGVVPWEGRGYRLGDWMLRNPSDLFVKHPDWDSEVLLPATPNALD